MAPGLPAGEPFCFLFEITAIMLAFPLGGRWQNEVLTDEGNCIEEVPHPSRMA